MAIDNLNYYSAGLPAGQQTDKYSSQPGCLKSKNLDIFSSSKSIRATARSAATQGDSDIIKQDGVLILKTDGKVYERNNGVDTLIADPSVNFPSYPVSYNGKTGTYVGAQWGTPLDMVVKYEGDEWKSFVVFTDRASYTYSKTAYTLQKEVITDSLERLRLMDDGTFYSDGWHLEKTTTLGNTSRMTLSAANSNFSKVPISIKATQYSDSGTNIALSKVEYYECKYIYRPDLDNISYFTVNAWREIPLPEGSIRDGWVTLDVPVLATGYKRQIRLTFSYTQAYEGMDENDYNWKGILYVNVNQPDQYMEGYAGDYNGYYSYLPIDENRRLVNVGEYYWMPKISFQTLYYWDGSWVYNQTLDLKTRYDLVEYMGWNNDTAMKVIGMMAWNEQIYMIGNMDGNGYIIPCDLSGGRGTPYIAYGCEFKGVANIDYLMYLVGYDRGVSQLWVYNGQELVPIVGGNETYNGGKNLIETDEQYHFDGRILEYKGNLILTTDDNRIFQYGQTYGGKGGVFIHQLPGAITSINTAGDNLEVKYNITAGGVTTAYTTTYLDAVPYKNYNTEWSATYPIVIGNHLLEKEESDLFTSFILPSADCSLEFRGMANHYHFWTFTSADTYTFDPAADYKMKGCTGDYVLKFIEKNDNQYTFRLEGDLPVQSTSDMKITNAQGTELITYSEYNHFRKIGEITTDKYLEGEFRFHNLNNKLELPKSHSLQIMVNGKGTQTHTPELFALDLVANQRDRG